MEELDRIYEAAVADDWEEQNKQEKDSFPEWDKAIKNLYCAKATLSLAVGLLTKAAAHVEGSTQEDRIASLSNSLEDIATQIAIQIERM